ncbi:MAG: HlyD family efflux transporter periplasmic adaptor subunit [Pirellulales bacterium]
MSTSEYSQSSSSQRSASVDADQVERAKREIQGLVQEIAELSRSDVSPVDFYDAMLNKVVAALAAPGGAVWTVSDAGGLQLVYQINLRQTGLIENPIGQSQHGRLLGQVMKGTEGALIAPHSGTGEATDNDEEAAANPTEFLLVMAPVHNDQGPQGVVEVFQRPGARVATQRGYLRFLLQVCEFAGDFLKARRLSHLAEKQSLWEQLETFTRTVHEKLDARQTAYTIANEGRRLIGCDRVSVAICRGGRCPIEAVSGQDTFDKRSNVTVMLGRLAAAVTKTGEDVWYSGDTSDMAPQVEAALDAYVDESHTKAMAILPLAEPGHEEEGLGENAKHEPPRVIGALIVEQMVDSRTPDGFLQRVDVVRGHSATALTNALEYEGLFLMPLWRFLGRGTRMFRGEKLPKTAAISTAIVLLLAVLCFWPKELKLEGKGRLRPSVRRSIYATLDNAVIDSVPVSDGQIVNHGDELVIMRSIELETQQREIEGQLTQALSRMEGINNELMSPVLPETERVPRTNELAQLEAQLPSYRAKLDLIAEKVKMLRLTSPISGQVISWQVKQQLEGRPVNRQQILMEVVDPKSDWELEVFMPESRMGHVQKQIDEAAKTGTDPEVTFFLAVNTRQQFTGRLKSIDLSADARGEKGNTVKLLVAFDQQALRDAIDNPKVNSTAIAKVHCGKRAIGYVYLHDLIDFIRAKILFRL